MPINAKINGSWSNGTPFIKTSSSWTTAKQVFAKVNGTWQTVYTSSISDNFDRANSASLGNVPDTDYTWTQTDGSWSINTNRVESVTSPASYPMIDIDFSTQNVAIGANINATGTSQASGKYGAGIAFWIVDATNWWAAYNDVVLTGTTTYTCASTFNGKPLQSGQGTATCVYDYAATATTTPGSEFCSSGVGPVSSFARYNGSTTDQVKYNVCITATRDNNPASSTSPLGCRSFGGFKYYRPIGGTNECYQSFNTIGTSSNPPTTTYSCPDGGTLSGTTCLMSNSATTGTTYSYSQKVKLINSINNSVAVVNTYTVNDNTWIPANISVSTSGNTITLRAYANDDNTGSSWIQTYTATSSNRGNRHGLMLGPRADSIVSQATSLDNFTLSAV
jgi:hypothetical protein